MTVVVVDKSRLPLVKRFGPIDTSEVQQDGDVIADALATFATPAA